jgi:hypothetical protein
MIHAYGGTVNASGYPSPSFGMRNAWRLVLQAEVLDKVVFRPWKSMKARGLAAPKEAYAVFSTETSVPRWKLLARGGAEE